MGYKGERKRDMQIFKRGVGSPDVAGTGDREHSPDEVELRPA